MLLFVRIGSAQFIEHAGEAFQLSDATGKPVLLLFEGSDWCAPCVRLEKTVLGDTGFSAYATERLVLLRADFPQRKKIPATIREQNEALADRYNPKGMFPYLVLVRPGGTSIASMVYRDESAEELIAIIDQVINEPTSGIQKTK